MPEKVSHHSAQILELLKEKSLLSSGEISEVLAGKMSLATVKRSLQALVDQKFIEPEGKGKATRYKLTEEFGLLYPVNVEDYFQKEIDERIIKNSFNHKLISETLSKIELFYPDELAKLNALHKKFTQNVSGLSNAEYNKEMERLAIDLSWKSSQIEGNTYSLLETEKLLKDKQTAAGKTKDEATMLLNHKDAIDYIVANTDYLEPLSARAIEDIHSILIKELGVDRNIRHSRVGISGTNYRPLDNEYQIREALDDMCNLINQGERDVFSKALLSLVLISYIQPFVDGNKRTARIVSNAILISNKTCPVSFRTVDSVDYKKAMLIFYEQNNISAFKGIFMEQYEFAVNTYF